MRSGERQASFELALLALKCFYMFRFDLIAKAMEKEPNKFLLVHLLSKRMHQLADGAEPLSSKTYDADVNTALQEFLDSAIALDPEVDVPKKETSE